MQPISKRRAELQARNNLQRLIVKQQNAPSTVEVIASNGVAVVVPIAEKFAPILKYAEDIELLDIAGRYELPISEQQRFLLAEGDTYLEQYDKIQLTEQEQDELINNQWSPLVSSNLKAVRIDGNDLLIWFHSGAKYRYPDQADMYIPFNEALSPGRLLWRTIRTIRGYSRI